MSNNVEGIGTRTLDEYTTGSATTARSAIKTPEGFNSVSATARVHKHQNANESQ